MRQCLFCNQPARTREDIWPKWLIERVAPEAPIVGYIGEDQISHGDPYVKAKCVCKTCNETWMSRLESANVPLIGCMLADIAIPLDTLQQFTVAQWAVKTTMTFASINLYAHGGWFTREERHALRTHSALPPRTTVWLGRFSGRCRLGTESHTVQYAMPEGGMADGYANTVLAGHLLLQVFVLHVPPEKEKRQTLGIPELIGPIEWPRLLIQIFPPIGSFARWPPAESISNFDQLSKRFALGTVTRLPARKRARRS